MEEGLWHDRAGAVVTHLPTRVMAAQERTVPGSQVSSSYLLVSR